MGKTALGSLSSMLRRLANQGAVVLVRLRRGVDPKAGHSLPSGTEQRGGGQYRMMPKSCKGTGPPAG